MNKQDCIAVVLGGPSTEAEVSRVTGKAIADALRSLGYNAQEVELVPDQVVETLRAMDAKVVFNAVHGKYGEDGRLQAILESAAIPYTGCGLLASAVAMDKAATKRFLLTEKISTPRSLLFNRRNKEDLETIKAKIVAALGERVVIKAASQGSSIGVYVLKDASEIVDAMEKAFSYCNNVVVEECIVGKEITVGLLEEEGKVIPLPIIWIAPHSGAYDYHSKYTKGATDYHCPAPFSAELTAKINDLAVRTYRTLNLHGVARVDMMLDEQDKPYVLEANTVPGMTSTSLVPKAAAAIGISFPELCEKILNSACKY